MLELLDNIVICNLKRVAKRFPTLRQLIEIELLNGSFARRIYGKAGPIIFGTVTVLEERDKEQIIAAMMSASLPMNQKLRENVGTYVDQGNIRLLVATSARHERLGQVFIYNVYPTRSKSTGYVFSLNVSLGARGMGIGRQLLRAVEKQARDDRMVRLGALVSVDNIRSLGLFKAVGYSIIPLDELHKRSRKDRVDVPEGKLLLEKLLSRNLQ